MIIKEDRPVFLRNTAMLFLPVILHMQLTIGNCSDLRCRNADCSDVRSIAISRKGSYVAAGYDSGVLKIWRLDTKGNEIVFRVGKSAINYLTFSRDESKIAAIDTRITIWDIAQGKLVRSLKHGARPLGCSFSENGGSLFTTSYGERHIRKWSVTQKIKPKQLDVRIQVFFSWHLYNVIGISDDQSMFIVTKRRADIRRIANGKFSEVSKICFSHNGLFCAYGDWNGIIQLRLLNSCVAIEFMLKHRDSCLCLAFASNSLMLATGSADNSVKLWETSTGQCRLVIKTNDMATAVCFSPCGRYLAVGSGNVVNGSRIGRIEICDVFTGARVWESGMKTMRPGPTIYKREQGDDFGATWKRLKVRRGRTSWKAIGAMVHGGERAARFLLNKAFQEKGMPDEELKRILIDFESKEYRLRRRAELVLKSKWNLTKKRIARPNIEWSRDGKERIARLVDGLNSPVSNVELLRYLRVLEIVTLMNTRDASDLRHRFFNAEKNELMHRLIRGVLLGQKRW